MTERKNVSSRTMTCAATTTARACTRHRRATRLRGRCVVAALAWRVPPGGSRRAARGAARLVQRLELLLQLRQLDVLSCEQALRLRLHHPSTPRCHRTAQQASLGMQQPLALLLTLLHLTKHRHLCITCRKHLLRLAKPPTQQRHIQLLVRPVRRRPRRRRRRRRLQIGQHAVDDADARYGRRAAAGPILLLLTLLLSRRRQRRRRHHHGRRELRVVVVRDRQLELVDGGRPVRGFLLQALDWLNATWPHPQHRVHNGAADATKAGSLERCMLGAIPSDVDLVLLEFTSQPENDFSAIERIVRRLRKYPKRPPLVHVATRDWCRCTDAATGAPAPNPRPEAIAV